MEREEGRRASPSAEWALLGTSGAGGAGLVEAGREGASQAQAGRGTCSAGSQVLSALCFFKLRLGI